MKQIKTIVSEQITMRHYLCWTFGFSGGFFMTFSEDFFFLKFFYENFPVAKHQGCILYQSNRNSVQSDDLKEIDEQERNSKKFHLIERKKTYWVQWWFKKKWVQWRLVGGRDDGQKQQRTETKAFNLLHIIVSVVRFLCSFRFWMQMESQANVLESMALYEILFAFLCEVESTINNPFASLFARSSK